MSDTSTGKVVVNRSMSLDGFIAGPGHTMDWGAGRPLADFVAPDDLRRSRLPPAPCSSAGGPRSGQRMEADQPGSVDYPFSGPFFVLTHGRRSRRIRRSRSSPVISGKRSPRHWTLRAGRTWRSSAPTWPASACGGARRRDLGVCDAGAARRRHPLLPPGPPQDRPGTGQQHAVARRHHPPVPRPQVVPATASPFLAWSPPKVSAPCATSPARPRRVGRHRLRRCTRAGRS